MTKKTYAILRTAKYKANSAITGIINHNNRAEGVEIEGVDPSRSHLNQTYGNPDKGAIYAAMRARIKTADKKPRPDANKLMEYLVTASEKFFLEASPETVKQYFEDAYKYAQEKHGADNVLAGWVHYDEKTPHMHIFVVPMATVEHKATKTRDAYTDVRLNAKHFTDGHKCLAALQTDFHKVVAEKFGLERGELFSKAKHAEVAHETAVTKALKETTEKELADLKRMADDYTEMKAGLAREKAEFSKDKFAFFAAKNAFKKEKEDFQIREEKFKREDAKLVQNIEVITKDATKVRALWQQSQEVKTFIDDPDMLSVMHKVKSDRTNLVRRVVLQCSALNPEIDNQKKLLQTVESMTATAGGGGGGNPGAPGGSGGLKPVDRTNDTDHDDLFTRISKGYDRHDRSNEDEYSR